MMSLDSGLVKEGYMARERRDGWQQELAVLRPRVAVLGTG